MKETIIILLIIILILSLSIVKIIREKKKGIKCVGCPYASQCKKIKDS